MVSKHGPSFFDLNLDVFFLILNFIPNIREKIRLRRVCRQFNWMVLQYFQYNEVDLTDKEHIYYKRSRSEENLQVRLKLLVSACPKLKRLRNDIVPIDWCLDQIKVIPNLEVLEIDWRKRRFLGLDILLSKCPNLNELGLIGYESDSGIRYKPYNLTSLCLDYCNIPFEDVQELVTINGGTLTRLEYHNPSDNEEDVKVNDVLIYTIGKHCPELRTLRLYVNCNSVDGLKKLTKLKNLFLIMNVSGNDVKEFMKNNTKLKWMVVHQKEINYTQALILCMRYCPKMRQISINNDRIPVFSEYEIKLWRSLPNLKLIHERPLSYYESNMVTFASD